MCGRYRLTAKERYLRDHFGLDEDPPWQPRWNIAPTQPTATIRQHPSEPRRIFGIMRWGLVPYWAKDQSFGLKTNILAWRWRDAGAWITKTSPREPTFKSADFMPRVSPLPLFVIGSTSSEWVTPEATRELFSLAHEPKKLAIVTARDHKFSGNTKAFFDVLREELDWVERREH
jgi:hypothetical protein